MLYHDNGASERTFALLGVVPVVLHACTSSRCNLNLGYVSWFFKCVCRLQLELQLLLLQYMVCALTAADSSKNQSSWWYIVRWGSNSPHNTPIACTLQGAYTLIIEILGPQTCEGAQLCLWQALKVSSKQAYAMCRLLQNKCLAWQAGKLLLKVDKTAVFQLALCNF